MERPDKYAMPRSGVRISMPIEVAERKRMQNVKDGIEKGQGDLIAILWLFATGKISKSDISIDLKTEELNASLQSVLDVLNPLGAKIYD